MKVVFLGIVKAFHTKLSFSVISLPLFPCGISVHLVSSLILGCFSPGEGTVAKDDMCVEDFQGLLFPEMFEAF